MNQEQPTNQNWHALRRIDEPFRKIFRPQKETDGAHVTTNEALESKHVWKSLSRVQKNICIQFSVADWQSGPEREFINYFLPDLHAEWSDVAKLIEQGIIEAQTSAVFSQRWLDENTALVAEYDAILADHFRQITHQERVVIQEISRHREIVKSNSPELRYRLRDETFYNWIVMKFDH